MSEIIKEAASKNRRGRPNAFSAEMMSLARFANPDVHSHRALVNTAYRQKALCKITNCECAKEYLWLADKNKMQLGEPNACKPEILTELGRVQDEAVFWDLAMIVCRDKPKTKDAIWFIRQWRNGKL